MLIFIAELATAISAFIYKAKVYSQRHVTNMSSSLGLTVDGRAAAAAAAAPSDGPDASCLLVVKSLLIAFCQLLLIVFVLISALRLLRFVMRSSLTRPRYVRVVRRCLLSVPERFNWVVK